MSVNELLDLIKNIPISDSWGPPSAPAGLLNGVPYMPFSKSDKLGRMADWTDGKDRDRSRGQFGRGREQQSYGVGAPSNPFAVSAVEEEGTFSVVDNTRSSKSTRSFGRGGAVSFRARGGRGGAQAQRGGRAVFQRVGGRNAPGGDRNARSNRGGRRSNWRDDKNQRNRESTVNVQPSWELVEEMDFLRLSKLNLDIGDGETIEGEEYGFLYNYDRDYDKNFGLPTGEKKLHVIDRAAYNVTTSSDPVIHELAKQSEGVSVYATDSILSVLMCAPRSVYPWDVVITRQGNKLFLDKRDESNLDVVTVNENSSDSFQDIPDNKDPNNSPNALILEATHINNVFPLQVVKENKAKEMAHKNPFYNEAAENDAPASKLYRYRTFDLSLDKDELPVELVLRTEVDAIVQGPGSGNTEHYATIKALNEFPSSASGGTLDWRRKLATNRGAVVATEMKNNSCKLARWTTQALLADADIMKLGFVTRAAPKNINDHIILGVFGSKPKDFASQMNLSMPNGWGIVRTVIDLCLKLSSESETSKFVIAKDPNASVLRLYKVPENAFDEEEEIDAVEEEEEEDDEE